MTDNAAARKTMVDCQISTSKVGNEYVMAAIGSIPREEFVPEKYRGVAYADDDLSIGEGRFLMEPAVFARLLQLARIGRNEKVLVVAAATGYAVAVIAQLAGEVVGLENNINFISAAQANMKKLGIANANFVKAELTQGAERQKPFDVIFINGAVDEIPQALISQLREDGRIVAIKYDALMPQGPPFAVLMHKAGKTVSEARYFQWLTERLHEFDKKAGFDF